MSRMAIRLLRGQITFVSSEDYAALSAYRWRLNDRGYVVRSFSVNGREVTVGMHREIMQPEAGLQVDHINHVRLDNQRENLCLITAQQNLQYRQRFRNNLSGQKGVSRQHDRWHARIQIDGHLIHLGFFGSITDAALAYDYAARTLFGEYALLNLPDETIPSAVQAQVERVLGAKNG